VSPTGWRVLRIKNADVRQAPCDVEACIIAAIGD